MEQSRRDFLKKSAVAGGIVWAVPAVTSLPAGAQTAGTPCSGQCTGGARGLALSGLLSLNLGVDNDPADSGPNCAAGAQLAQVAGASVICGEFADTGGGTCSANAHVAKANASNVQVTPSFPVVVAFHAITSNASTSGACSASGSSTVTELSVAGTAVANLTATSAPNTTITADVLGVGTVRVVLNEQTESCVNGVRTFTVRGLHVTVTVLGNTVADLIVAESKVGNTCCTC